METWHYLAIFVALMTLGYLLSRAEAKKIGVILDALAEKVQGRVLRPALTFPQLLFPLGPGEATISAMQGGSSTGQGTRSSQTYVLLPLPEYKGPGFEVRSRKLGDGVLELFRQSIEVEDMAFNQAFRVGSDDEGFVRAILDADLRNRFLELSRYGAFHARLHDVNVSVPKDPEAAKRAEGANFAVVEMMKVKQKRLDIHLQKVSTEKEEYETLLACFLKMYSQIQGSAGEA